MGSRSGTCGMRKVTIFSDIQERPSLWRKTKTQGLPFHPSVLAKGARAQQVLPEAAGLGRKISQKSQNQMKLHILPNPLDITHILNSNFWLTTFTIAKFVDHAFYGYMSCKFNMHKDIGRGN
jgi:hypothetical protein